MKPEPKFWNTPNDNGLTMTDECYSCRWRIGLSGDAHIACDHPDPDISADTYGLNQGWFVYPWNFDPTWKRSWCHNFERKEQDNG